MLLYCFPPFLALSLDTSDLAHWWALSLAFQILLFSGHFTNLRHWLHLRGIFLKSSKHQPRHTVHSRTGVKLKQTLFVTSACVWKFISCWWCIPQLQTSQLREEAQSAVTTRHHLRKLSVKIAQEPQTCAHSLLWNNMCMHACSSSNMWDIMCGSGHVAHDQFQKVDSGQVQIAAWALMQFVQAIALSFRAVHWRYENKGFPPCLRIQNHLYVYCLYIY